MLTEPLLVSCLSRYWGLTDVRVRVHNGGMGSETWFVDLGEQRWVAKAVTRADGGQFAGGMTIARRLEQAGIPAGAPVLAADGRLVADVGDAQLALLTWVPGRELTGEDDAEQQVKSTGATRCTGRCCTTWPRPSCTSAGRTTRSP